MAVKGSLPEGGWKDLSGGFLAASLPRNLGKGLLLARNLKSIGR